ncbi:hypothetical protein EDB83DRAFT_2656287 [Lactarius deliciosus]|nr:hypothetical protein EDB83DRAFT_2656287 [Lactarius deliciosus]
MPCRTYTTVTTSPFGLTTAISSRFHRCGRWRMRLLTKPLLQLHQHFVGVRSGQDGKGTQAPADRPQDQSPGGILSVVKASKGQNAVEVAVPTVDTDINAAYEDAIHVLSTKLPKEEKEEDATTMQEDYDRNFRTKCIAPSFNLLTR